MQKKSIKQKCLAWVLSLAVAVTFIPMTAGIAFADDIDLGNATISEISDVTYTGVAFTPEITVTDGEGSIIESSNYEVAYSDNIDPGNATVTVTPAEGSPYTGSATTTFHINKVDLANVPVGNFFLSEGNFNDATQKTEVAYDGNIHKPEVSKIRVYKGNGVKTDIKTGYTTSYPDTKGGSYEMAKENNTIVVTADADAQYLTGEATIYFDIIDSIESVKVGTSVGYNGEVTVAADIALDDADVLKTTAFSSGYTGTKYTTEKYLSIEKMLDKAGVAFESGNAMQFYTGSTISKYGKFVPTYEDMMSRVWYGESNITTLIGSNIPAALALEYHVNDADKVENAKAPLLMVGFPDQEIQSAGRFFASGVTQVVIVDTDIAKLSTSSAKASVTYTGKAIKPGVVAKDGDAVLEEGTDYEVVYSNNTNAGTAKATINGIGQYSGTATANFKINKAAQKMTVKPTTKTLKVKKLKKKAQTVTALTVTKQGGALTYSGVGVNKKSKKALKINAKTGKITVKKKTKKGTYKMKVTVKSAASTNYNASSKVVTVTIKVKK